MSVVYSDGLIALHGHCGVEDAEPLAQHLLAQPDLAVDLTAASMLHTAVIQVLVRFRPEIKGQPADAFIARWLMPQLTEKA